MPPDPRRLPGQAEKLKTNGVSGSIVIGAVESLKAVRSSISNGIKLLDF